MSKTQSKKRKTVYILLFSLVTLASFAAGYLYFNNQQKENKAQVETLKLERKALISRSKNLKESIEEAVKMNEEEEKPVVKDEEKTETPEADTIPQPVEQEQTLVQPPPATNNWWSYPANIVEIPLAQVTHKSIINKGQKLPSTYAPSDLVLLQSMPGLRVTKTLYVRSIIVEPLRQLSAAAQTAGIDLSAISAYRSYQTQQSTYQYWVNYNGGSVDAADQVSARPGHSEHQLGTVVDFSTNEISDAIGSQFHSTQAAAWLTQNAPIYGFKLSYPEGQETETGYAYESWHWRYWGE